MKSCKKLSAVLLAILLAFSVFSSVLGVAAESIDTTTLHSPTARPEDETKVVSPDDLIPTPPYVEPETGGLNPSEIASQFSSEFDDINSTLDEGSSFIKDILNKMQEFLDAILNFLSSITNFPLGSLFG